MKRCNRCGREYPATLEYFHRADGGLRGRCKPCLKEIRDAKPKVNRYPQQKEWRERSEENWQRVLANNRAWRKRNPEKARIIGFRQHLKRQGWTYEAWQAAMTAQGGVCAVSGCGRPATDADHCHATGRRRMLLCAGCNKALGLIADCPDRARGLAAYLEDYDGAREGAAVPI